MSGFTVKAHILSTTIMAELFYIIGASGVGKDSLISYAREKLAGTALVAFAHRYITRDADAGHENHISLTINEFSLRDKHGCYAMQWHSHATSYGIGIEIEQWLDRGLNVVVNGSREYLQNAAEKFSQLTPVLITADKARLKERLHLRGRETDAEIEKRLQQASKLNSLVEHPRLIRLQNNTDLEVAGNELVAILQGRKPE